MALLHRKRKEKEIKEKLSWRKELKMLPCHLLLWVWIGFAIICILWIFAASLSTSGEIFRGETLKFATGFHFENYVKAWKLQNVSVYFMNSLIYASVSSMILVVICAPAAYVLARYTFLGNKTIKSGLVLAMSIPSIMIILPILNITTALKINGTRGLLIFLYVAVSVPYTVTFLLDFFSHLSRTYEEAAAIDGCGPIRTFWKIMFPLAQPGIITVTIFNFLGIWNEYFMSLVFASVDSKRSVGVGLFTIVSAMKQNGDYGALFAAVIIVFLPTFLLYLLLSQKVIAGVTGGGIKG
ncbi:carbohydrate ABC transporter permease [Lachnoclostridium sp. An181]|uniref:carbohydrate ABC transporter permease n=1 Tax=Lachnoclostridium sp. An181 TaxID=1965575 RepID=UPI000B389636|nr:carbohydrate ABC transporter permease [Lachnoclostridium sp. An181]OUP48084.1 sugar ABC transporter permease [Lachnoclostridium sp. An181]